MENAERLFDHRRLGAFLFEDMTSAAQLRATGNVSWESRARRVGISRRWGAGRFRRILERTVEACVEAGVARGEIVRVSTPLIRGIVRDETERWKGGDHGAGTRTIRPSF